MEALILDKDWEPVALLDVFKSFIWTDRYLGYGDFEIVVPADAPIRDYIRQDYYIWCREHSDRLMIIETIETKVDIEDGNFLTITGRSLESILERRIIWGYRQCFGNMQMSIRNLLNQNAISPSDSARKIPNLEIKMSDDTNITKIEIDTQYFGENLYESIYSLCEEKKVGFRILPNFKTKKMIFELYFGVDRSYEQTDRPYVAFSPAFDNFLSSNYIESKTALKNAVLVGGNGEGLSRKTVEVTGEHYGTGLDRREMFTDANGVSSDVDTTDIEQNETLTPDEKAQLISARKAAAEQAMLDEMKQIGKEALADTSITQSFEGEVEARIQFIYGKDFTIGDLVQVQSEYGQGGKARVAEIIFSSDENGDSMIPTFTTEL